MEDISSTTFLRRILAGSIAELQGESYKNKRSIRWELGACWVQHLQNEKSEPKKTEDTNNEQTVKGLGKKFGHLKGNKKVSRV